MIDDSRTVVNVLQFWNASRNPKAFHSQAGCKVIVVIMRLLHAACYVAAGLVHLYAPDAFLPIMPGWVPFPWQVVIFTGACELVGAAALLTHKYRRAAGIMLALYAVFVFPANIKHALEGVQVAALPSSWWYHAPRLLAQPVLVWWALFCSGVIDWPVRKKAVY